MDKGVAISIRLEQLLPHYLITKYDQAAQKISGVLIGDSVKMQESDEDDGQKIIQDI